VSPCLILKLRRYVAAKMSKVVKLAAVQKMSKLMGSPGAAEAGGLSRTSIHQRCICSCSTCSVRLYEHSPSINVML